MQPSDETVNVRLTKPQVEMLWQMIQQANIQGAVAEQVVMLKVALQTAVNPPKETEMGQGDSPSS